MGPIHAVIAAKAQFGKRNKSSINMEEKKFCCEACNKDNISFQVWASEHTALKCGIDDEVIWCDDCEDHTKYKTKA